MVRKQEVVRPKIQPIRVHIDMNAVRERAKQTKYIYIYIFFFFHHLHKIRIKRGRKYRRGWCVFLKFLQPLGSIDWKALMDGLHVLLFVLFSVRMLLHFPRFFPHSRVCLFFLSCCYSS